MPFFSSAAGRKIHRHYVVLPLAVLLLMVSFSGRQGALRASTVTGEIAYAPGEQFSVGEGISAVVQGETDAVMGEESSAPVLRSGTVLLKADGILQMKAGAIRIRGIGGAFYASLPSAGKLTLAAFEAPLLVRDARGGTMVLPPYSQWRQGENLPSLTPETYIAWREAARTEALPPSFLEEQLRLLEQLPSADLPPAAPSVSAKPTFFLLPAARARAEAGTLRGVIGHVRWLLERGEGDRLGAFLAREDIARILGTAPARNALAILLTRSSLTPAARLALLPFLLVSEDVRLLASVHPVLRATASLLPPAETEETDMTLLRLLSLPRSDVLADSSDAGLTRRWEAETKAFLVTRTEDALAMLMLVLEEGEEALLQMQLRGFPERRMRYAAALRALASPFQEEHAQQLKPLLARLDSMEEQQDPFIEVSEEVSEATSTASPPLFSRELIATLTADALRRASALYTVQTTVTPLPEEGTASVRGIVFGTRLFDFTYDPRTDEARDIIADGARLPNALPLSRFAAWARGDGNEQD